MITSILAFLGYFSVSVFLIGLFITCYVAFTPYREFEMIRENNMAAAITLSGALLGFVFPLTSAIFFTHSITEMLLWAGISGIVQLGTFTAFRRFTPNIERGDIAPALFVSAMSVAFGILNAVSISW